MYDAWSNIRSNTILHNIQENLGCSLDEVVPTLESVAQRSKRFWNADEVNLSRKKKANIDSNMQK